MLSQDAILADKLTFSLMLWELPDHIGFVLADVDLTPVIHFDQFVEQGQV